MKALFTLTIIKHVRLLLEHFSSSFNHRLLRESTELSMSVIQLAVFFLPSGSCRRYHPGPVIQRVDRGPDLDAGAHLYRPKLF